MHPRLTLPRILLPAAVVLLSLAAAGQELLVNGGFEKGLEGWYNWSKEGTSVTVVPGAGPDGSAAAVMDGGAKARPASLATRRLALEGGATLQLSLRARADDEPVTLTLRFTPRTPAGEFLKEKLAWRSWRVEPGPWQELTHTFVTPKEVGEGGLCYFTFFSHPGRVALDNVSLKPYEGGRVLRFKGQDIPPGRPEPHPFTPLPERGDVLFYQRPDPGDFDKLRGDEPPVEGELVQRVGTFSARGAEARLWFGVVGQKDLVRPALEVSPLRHPDGQALPAGAVRLSRILLWPRRITRQTLSYRMSAELLEPLPLEDGRCTVPGTVYDTGKWDWTSAGHAVLRQGEPHQFLLALTVPADAAPGAYRGTLTVRARDAAPARLAVSLTVLRYAIERPDPRRRYWSLDGDTYRYAGSAPWTVERIRREMAVLHAAGYDGLKCKGLWRQVVKDGQWTDIEIPNFLNLLHAMRAAGMAGPVYVSNQRLPQNLGQWLGAKFDPDDMETWTPEFHATLKRALDMLAATMRAQGLEWFLYPADEIYGTDRRLASANILNTIHRIAPEIPICVTTDVDFTNEAVPGAIDRRMYNPRFCAVNEAVNRIARSEAERLGAPFDIYGSGAYGSQMGNVSANRYWAGAVFWKTGAIGHHSWTLQRCQGSIWNAFDGHDFVILYPPKFDDAPFTCTLQWQGIKDGILDCWYFRTLERTLDRAAAADAADARELAAAVRTEYERKLDSVPWAEDYWRSRVDSGRLENLRWWAARATQQLEDALAGRPPAEAPAPAPLDEDALATKFYPDPPPDCSPAFQGLTHPFAEIAKLDARPRIDGLLDPECEARTKPLSCLPAQGRGVPPTRLRLGHTEDALWVFAECEEPSMDKLKERLPTGKGKVWRDDSIELFLDANFDQRSCWQFIVNTAGNCLVYRTVCDPDGKKTSAEKSAADWSFKIRKAPDRWTVELLVPLATIGGRPGICGIGFSRNRWASGREEHFLHPERVWLFNNPGLFAPAPFAGGPAKLRRLSFPKSYVGPNRMTVAFESWPEGLPPPELATTQGAAARLTRAADDPATFHIEYDLPGPGAYEIDLVVRDPAGAAPVRRYAIHPLVTRILDPPDASLRLYNRSEPNIRFPFRLYAKPEALGGLAIHVRLRNLAGAAVVRKQTPESTRFDVLVRPASLAPGPYALALEVSRKHAPTPILTASTPFELLSGYE